MFENNTIRETRSDELSDILSIYPLAFPDEELRPLVSELIESDADVLSLAAYRGDKLIGHVVFTIFSGLAEADKKAAALLGPLCVMPEFHGNGFGSALVRHGFELLTDRGIRQTFVLGDPNYYGRFGYRSEERVLPPYSLSEELAGAWQSMVFSKAEPLQAGQGIFPDVWMKPALWG